MKITFEGIDAPGDNATTDVPDGNGGMNWTNFSAVDPAGSIFIPSGVNNGIVSGTSVAINSFADPATFATQSTDFQLKKGWFTSAWNNGMTVTVEAFDDGISVGTKSFIVNYDAPTKVKFGIKFVSIDSVTISSSGGTDANGGDAGAGTHVAIEDLVVRFEPPPERVGEHDRHLDAGYDMLADAGLDASAFSHWMFA